MRLTKKMHSLLSRIDRNKNIPEKLELVTKSAENMFYVNYLGLEKGYELTKAGKEALEDHRQIIRKKRT